jgi:hypothetical protein
MADYYILDNLDDFNECNLACYNAHMLNYNDGNGYDEQTNCWTAPYQRLTDDKYICLVCPSYDNEAGYTIEQSHPSWFPPPDS